MILHFLKKAWLPLIIVVVSYLLTPAFNRLQRGWDDWLMRRHLASRFEAPIRIVYFDEKDIESLGGWPLPRNIYAYLAKKLNQLGARTIGFDIYWGPRPHGPDENDFLLAAVLAQHRNICGSFYFESISQTTTPEGGFASLEWPLPESFVSAPSAAGLQAPAVEFLQGPGRYGFANLSIASDGAIRESDLLLRNGDAAYPGFAKVLAHAFSAAALDSVLPQIRINYRLAGSQIPLISVREVLQAGANDAPVTMLQGSLVLVGVISSQLGFTKPTPVDPAMPVVGIHAQMIDNLLNKSYLRPFSQWLWICTLVLLALIAAFWQPEKLRVAIWTPIVLAALLFVSAIVLWKAHITFPLYAGFAGILLLSIPYLVERAHHQKRMIAAEATKLEALEKQFADMVRATSRLREENEATRRQHQTEIERLRRELTLMPLATNETIQHEFPEIICSPASPLAKILAELPRVAATDAPVLITGESGTGKELIAKAIHQKSKRAGQAFVAVNCGALAESLLESELFGHEKGAFTGAHQAKAGFFETANKGTIFLDEISATTPSFQARLLRVLQEGQYFRVGSTQVRTVDVRVIAASNQSFEKLVAAKEFRDDLYFRLNVLPVYLPPLRERVDDIALLLSHFLQGDNCKISAEAMRLLQAYAWPGNIRELQNIAARMKVLGMSQIVDSDWVRKQLSLGTTPAPTSEALDDKILQLYRELKFRNDANTQIAQRLGHLHRSTVTEYLKGMTFLFFAESDYQIKKALRRFNPSPNSDFDVRLENRMFKYLRNLRDELDQHLPLEENLTRLQTRLRKLPQRYHAAAMEVAKAYLQGKWKL
ncbi:sigma 54-interacting transcriptional regulator [candidate division KSB1 bacterium]|nr:sigma 54-interacting transcriptional regulator [candidate division KSB1 bacterium]